MDDFFKIVAISIIAFSLIGYIIYYQWNEQQKEIERVIDYCTNKGMIYIDDTVNYIQCLDNETNTMKYYAMGD